MIPPILSFDFLVLLVFEKKISHMLESTFESQIVLKSFGTVRHTFYIYGLTFEFATFFSRGVANAFLGRKAAQSEEQSEEK